MQGNLASDQILRRIEGVDLQIQKASESNDETKVAELSSVRRAYIVDLMDVLNEEGRLLQRRSTDTFKPYSLPDVEQFIKDRRSPKRR